jgi:anti-sigma factor RsiW
MGSGAEGTKPTARELSDLSALADGKLDPGRRAELEARIAGSPELSALYERERRILAALHQARATDRAPAGLRARVQAARPSRGTAARRRIAYGGAFAGSLAVLALALALLLPAGTPGGPSVSAAAALATRGPTQPAPAPDPARPAARLQANVDDVYFPNWVSSFGWRALGERTDRLDGRLAETVYYRWGSERLAYTIVAAPALAEPAAPRTSVGGTEMRTLTLDGRLVVTWRRAGDTCVLSGTGVTAAELQKLAAWKVPADH